MEEPKVKTDFKIKNDNGILTINNVNYNTIQKNFYACISAFESVCLPRIILNEETMEISDEKIDKILKEILKCSICYEIFEEPVNLKNCLHKFCKKCIGDYNRKIKKECAICRHPIETRRLMKDDEKIKEIINCIIPDINKFKNMEDNILLTQIKGCFFKDEERYKKQIENTRKEDENEEKELRIKYRKNNNNDNNNINSNIINNNNNINNHYDLNYDENEKFFINKKRFPDISIEEANEILNSFNKGNKILIRLNYEKFNGFNEFFEKTKIKLQDNYSLDFITRFICYKQNLKSEHLDKIAFYTYENDNKTKKEWNNHNTIIKTIVDYDKSHNNCNQETNNINLIQGASDCYYILNLYYVFS